MNDPASSLNDAVAQPDSALRMTKREYFAAHLFRGVTANLSVNSTLRDKAKHAVDAADALIEALEESTPNPPPR